MYPHHFDFPLREQLPKVKLVLTGAVNFERVNYNILEKCKQLLARRCSPLAGRAVTFWKFSEIVGTLNAAGVRVNSSAAHLSRTCKWKRSTQDFLF